MSQAATDRIRPEQPAIQRRCREEEIMSILFVLLTFLLILTVMYFRRPQAAEDTLQVANAQQVPVPIMMQFDGFAIPHGYAFHPGHTWLNDEGHQNARIGLDAFAANLIGKIDAIDFAELNRWIRQGQRLCTITRGGRKVELLSPVEGVLTSINHELLKNLDMAIDDPYKDGWLCTIKAPELAFNRNNLLQGSIVPAWMQNSAIRMGEMLSQLTPSLAQDGGLPIKGVLFQVSPDVQKQLTKEFFLI
jgi:glycine cleavage system H protein